MPMTDRAFQVAPQQSHIAHGTTADPKSNHEWSAQANVPMDQLPDFFSPFRLLDQDFRATRHRHLPHPLISTDFLEQSKRIEEPSE